MILTAQAAYWTGVVLGTILGVLFHSIITRLSKINKKEAAKSTEQNTKPTKIDISEAFDNQPDVIIEESSTSKDWKDIPF